MTVTDLGGEIIEREIPGVGLLRFENFEAGRWLTQKGQPAKVARRRYTLGELELDSVSSIAGTVGADGLVYWAEDHGARGGAKAERMGMLEGVADEDIIDRVRALKLGADQARDEASNRGTAIHLALHTLATCGEPPNVGDYPHEWRKWVQGAVRAWMCFDPETIDAEFMVCDSDLAYAGRPDLYCRSGGKRVLLDYKTGRGKVYDGAHYQTRGYADCFEGCGIEPPDRIVILGIDNEGGFQVVDCAATTEDWRSLIHVFRSRKRINAAMAAQRKLAKQVERAAS